MQKEKNGSMEERSRPKDIVQNHSKPLQDVLASPVSSYRKMYRAWKLQQEEEV
jgi:hypothetical protein